MGAGTGRESLDDWGVGPWDTKGVIVGLGSGTQGQGQTGSHWRTREWDPGTGTHRESLEDWGVGPWGRDRQEVTRGLGSGTQGQGKAGSH